ncbi:glycoside hydrolase family 36 protein [Kineosporia babensis]|uniref:Alpha-galactosidase n=1 Tax=Kineosporia babensis TaxID=499548 RepID=A0A9X1SSK8_9ACTN|nr:glycoside hydrolase family 36 protein [Kineosporia babensis]MCD5310689.1 alpha-galactosidase [Kineosporia babensis]
MSIPVDVVLSCGALRAVLGASGDTPLELRSLTLDGAEAVRPHPLVEVLTASERHERMTLGYRGTTVGARLRPTVVEKSGAAAVVTQTDQVTGLSVRTRLALDGGGLRLSHELRNDGAEDVVVFAVPTLSVSTAAEPAQLTLASGRSEWLGEGRWREDAVADLLPELGFAAVAQPDRTGFGQSSAGGWPTGSVLPVAVLSTADAVSIGWQIESSAGWQWSLSRGDGGVVLSAGGPTEREHQAAVRLRPGDTFETVAAGLVVSDSGRDGAFAALTRHRRGLREVREIERSLPIVYNDYMNTLMGQPNTERLLPLIAAAGEAGAEYFCIDAGWFTESTDYWSEVGEWREAPTRFDGGLGRVIAAIRDAGMRPGLWIEPESVGLDSPVAGALPADAFFQRYGAAVVEQRRRHLDLRHPAAVAHLDAAVDHLVAAFGIEYLKLDYNIEPGSGTDVGGLAPGHGLLAHTRALRDWLVALQRRHPQLLIENCASGAMRSDYHLLAVTHLQSTSDQQDALRYAAIAASAPATILPEQAGNWAYPAAAMSQGELDVTLVSGLAGRFYLSGFLNELSADAFARVQEAVATAKTLRGNLVTATPFWPIGMPGWDDDILCLGLRQEDGSAVFCVWSRGTEGVDLVLPDVGAITQIFPSGAAWRTSAADDHAVVTVPAGPAAAVFRSEGAAS